MEKEWGIGRGEGKGTRRRRGRKGDRRIGDRTKWRIVDGKGMVERIEG